MIWLGSIWQPSTYMVFSYHGQARWCGPWNNPNTFGMLMGVGFVLLSGLLVRTAWFPIQPKAWLVKRGSVPRGRLAPIFISTATLLVGVGLVKSYSRGAWIGTAFGLIYLGYYTVRSYAASDQLPKLRPSGQPQRPNSAHPLPSIVSFIHNNRITLVLTLISLILLGFWNRAHLRWLPAQRFFSVGNSSDFSWRNRVTAWEGALQMMSDHFWVGYGWNQPERVYDRYYRPTQIPEYKAFQTNDYFELGTTLGFPALAFFIVYMARTLARRPRLLSFTEPGSGVNEEASEGLLRLTCHAAVVVLIVGFWFDSGLFNMATAAPFWVLLEWGGHRKFDEGERVVALKATDI
jgi:O-antigen ligase